MASGISNKFKLKEAQKTISNLSLPINFYKSISNFEKNEFSKSILGEDIHYHYGLFYNYEYSEFMNQVDDWERNRYLYQI